MYHLAFEISSVLWCVSAVCSFVLLSSIPLYEYTSLFIHFPDEGHLGCSQVLVTHKANVNIHVQVFYEQKSSFPLGKYLGVGSHHMVISFLTL